jgi:ATP-dependent DNA ligase
MTIELNVFDGMLLKDWVEQTPHMMYGARTEFVRIVLSDIKATNIKQVDHVVVNSEAELKNFFSKCMDEGFEGIMLKTMDSYYEFKRSDNIRKLKPCVTYEGVVVSCYDGRRGTKREGTFGGMEILLPNGVITRLGSGFNDAIRADVQLEGYDAYVGRIVEIEAQPDPLTADGLSVDGKARFPVFCRFRSPADVDSKVVDAYDAYVKGSR